MKYYDKTLSNFAEIVERFDFESVHALMVVNHWSYCGEQEVPTVARLKSMVMSMIYTLAENTRPNCSVSSGGFILTRFEWDHAFDYQLVFAWKDVSQSERKEEL